MRPQLGTTGSLDKIVKWQPPAAEVRAPEPANGSLNSRSHRLGFNWDLNSEGDQSASILQKSGL